jgi:hypothetical protein
MSKYPSHVGSELGKILINSKEHKEVARAIRECLKGESVLLRLSKETQEKLKRSEELTKNGSKQLQRHNKQIQKKYGNK